MKNVILIGTKGVPAKHGAFEQFAHVFSKNFVSDYKITVYCEGRDSGEYIPEINRVFIPVLNFTFYPILYDLFSIVHFILSNKRKNSTVFIFGYTAAPFFVLLNLMKVKYFVNTDGYEYKRAKFGRIAKFYLRFAEKMAVFWAGNNLITDSSDLVRYFQIRYNVDPNFIAYGFDPYIVTKVNNKTSKYGKYDICVQRLEPENNIELIIEAYRVSERKLLIVGPTTRWFDEKMKNTLTDNIIYLGPIYDRDFLMTLRSDAERYVHGHSVGGMNPVLIESLQFKHIPMLFLTPHNYEVYGTAAYYFYDKTSLTNLLSHKITRQVEDPRHSQSRFTWDYILNQYKALI
jgi:glycosyltransferase involved in cell wall biosynthesis